ncbi:hypothetical protein [Novosphingobium sp.]|uniref:hypothetical protein n=1 Tax=Novosphingobium sp. TaxID=1874826 RepID=UPI002FDA09BC
MVDPTASTGDGTGNARNHFAKAMEEAKAGAQALADECREKFTQATGEWTDEAKSRSEEAREKATTFASDAKSKASEYANEGKARTSQAIVGLSKMIDENAHLIDEKVGAKYGDYVRTAAKSMQDAGTRLDEKSFDELGEDAKEFVRKSPGLAVGMAIAAGFMVGRMFKKSE